MLSLVRRRWSACVRHLKYARPRQTGLLKQMRPINGSCFIFSMALSPLFVKQSGIHYTNQHPRRVRVVHNEAFGLRFAVGAENSTKRSLSTSQQNTMLDRLHAHLQLGRDVVTLAICRSNFYHHVHLKTMRKGERDTCY